MSEVLETRERLILTPDQRLRIFISSTLNELAPEREAAAQTIRGLHMSPVLFEIGARPHPPRDLYRSYLDQSHIFVGIYGQSYGWIAPDMEISGLEDEFRLSSGKPRLVYVKEPVPDRDPALEDMLDSIRSSGSSSYKPFSTPEELAGLLADDLAVLFTERFETLRAEERSDVPLPQAPVTRTSFVGRDRDVDAILSLIRDPNVWLVTLFGPGGIGKTRLALEVGRKAEELFPDGVAVIWLDAIGDPDLVPEAIASMLEIRDPPGGSIMTAIAERLAGKRMLLVLDNFEHVIAAAHVVPDILALASDTKILVTSRTLLQVRGEHAYEIVPLEVPDAGDAVGPEEVAGTEAVRLFVDRAKAVAAGFEVTDDNATAIAELARRLEGLPLALELAAARIRTLTPQAIVERLVSRLDLLKSGPRDLPDRQRTIRDTVRWSYDLLEPAEREALEALSVFAGEASLDAARAVMGYTDEQDAIDILVSLLDKSLIRRIDDRSGEPRFRMLEMIAEYGREQLIAHDELDDVRDRHILFFLEMADAAAADLFSPRGPDWYSNLERDHPNLQAAMGWLLEQRRAEEGLRLAVDLQWFWWIRGHFSTAKHWLTSFLELDGGSDRSRARALSAAALMTIELGDPRTGKSMFEQALPILAAEGDDDGRAWAQSGLGYAMSVLGDPVESGSLQRAALDTFVDNGDLLGQCNANTRLAALAAAEGDYEATEEYLQHSLAARRKLQDPWGIGYVLNSLGAMHVKQGDPSGAETYLLEALPSLRRVGSKESVAGGLDSLGHVAAMKGRWAEATSLYEEALEIYREIGSRSGIVMSLVHLGRAALERDAITEATEMFRSAFEIAKDMGNVRSLVAAVEGVATALAHQDRSDEAGRLLGSADALREDNGLPRRAAWALATEAAIAQTGAEIDARSFDAARAEGRTLSLDEVEATILS